MPTENRSSNTELSKIVTEALVGMVSGVTGMKPPPGEPLPGFIQAPIDRAVTRISGLLAQPAPQPHAEPDSYPPCDYCGITPDYHPWHGSGMLNGVENRHIHACDGCRGQLPLHPGQPHPEPIAWMVGTAFWWTKEEAERDAAATGLKAVPVDPMVTQHGEPAWFMTEGGLSAMHAKAKAMSYQQGLDTSSYSVPLYTHADPGEVERLRKENEGLRAGWYKDESDNNRYWPEELEEAKAELAARTADRDERLRKNLNYRDLLRAVINGKSRTQFDGDLMHRILMALSASAEPSVPLAWHVGGNGYDRICFEKPTDLPDQPCIQPIHDQRQLIDLLKRYNLCNEDAGEPVELDALTDLATWKRRAIEAESKLRTYDPQVVELGEQAMQSLLANPKPSELVLTKCRLCDQLQADLTELDQRIDLLEQQIQHADHWLEFASFNSVGEPVEHTQEMRDEFRKQMIAAVFPDLESRPEERGTPETEPCSGCGTPGWTGACNKCIPY